MDTTEARTQLRQAFFALESAPPAERDAKLRQEVRQMVARTPKPDQPALLASLAEAFPVWPTDVPPAPPPDDEEMIQKLRMRMDRSDDDRKRIVAMMRQHGLAAGMSAEDEKAVRDKVAMEAAAVPELPRVIEAFILVLGSLTDADVTVRKFLQEHGLGMMMVGVPRLKDAIARLLTVPDGDAARHAKRSEVESVCNQLVRAVALLCHWPDAFAEDAAVKLAPNRIEATVPQKGLIKRPDYEGFWREYVTRVGGRKDESNVKAELLGQMATVMRDTI
jgi:hypothetical protein